MHRSHYTVPGSHDRKDSEVEKHPIFWRLIDDNHHFIPGDKEIGHMWEMICEKLPHKSIHFETGTKKQQYKEVFYAIYTKVKNLFSSQNRSDGTPYFYHLLETVFILIEESSIENLDPETLFVGLLHDIIEDTDNYYDSLWRNINPKWKELAFWVHLISKPHFHTHIENEEENNTYKNCISSINSENIDLSWKIIDESAEDPEVVKQYNNFRRKYKPIRNKSHFEKYKDLETFINYAKSEAGFFGLKYSEEWMKKICIRSINVKLADRLHNLRTLWHMSDYKIIRKTQETRTYLLNIADEVNPVMAGKLRKEIKKLESEVAERLFDWISSETKDNTVELVKV